MNNTGKSRPQVSEPDVEPVSLSVLGSLVRGRGADPASLAEAVDVPAGSVLHLSGVQLIQASTTSAETETPVSAGLLNQRGTVQGGVYSVIADATAGWATEAFLGNDAYATTSVTTQLVGVAVEGDLLVACARVAHGGRRTVIATAEVYRRRPEAEDRLMALVTCQQLVIEPT